MSNSVYTSNTQLATQDMYLYAYGHALSEVFGPMFATRWARTRHLTCQAWPLPATPTRWRGGVFEPSEWRTSACIPLTECGHVCYSLKEKKQGLWLACPSGVWRSYPLWYDDRWADNGIICFSNPHKKCYHKYICLYNKLPQQSGHKYHRLREAVGTIKAERTRLPWCVDPFRIPSIQTKDLLYCECSTATLLPVITGTCLLPPLLLDWRRATSGLRENEHWRPLKEHSDATTPPGIPLPSTFHIHNL